ncbi:MAG: hypothetical protein IH591_12025, partial [Bacteroidales bacterium]|nr:hypothetical protein [Bacteroidales bacterium]
MQEEDKGSPKQNQPGATDGKNWSGDAADTAAWIITVVFHPVFLPLYGLLLIFNIPTLLVFMPGEIRRVLFLMVLVNNVI